jgi:hypothetical protein
VILCAIVGALVLIGGVWIGASLQSGTEPAGLRNGAALAVGPPYESTHNGMHLYNFSMESVSAGVTWNRISLGLQTDGGAPIAGSAAGWNVTAFGLTGDPAAFYSIQSMDLWTSTGTMSLESGDALLVTSPSGASLSGDELVLNVEGSAHESISVAIP